MTKDILLKEINEAAQNLKALQDASALHNDFENMINEMVKVYKNGGGLYVAGNGGSAADAQHFVAELVVKLSKNRDPIKAVALTVDTSIITAAGNDFSYDEIFSRQVEALMGPKDMFIGITTSGNSPNILKCFSMCKKIGAKSVLLSGKDGGKAVKEKMADINLVVPGPNTARIQEVHEILYHTICLVLEKKLIEEKVISYRP
ncbi:MAG: phosphoheptose isomerase [Pseudobdellovibrio sp.]|jgi:D-sedoheptulose 7-phosphate isomerase|nr:phosphoheptose isomerase [Pseudobdellovibrio sp.]